MKKTFLLIFFSWLLFFVLIPPLHTPDEPEHYENTFWVSRFIYPYQPRLNRSQPKNKIKPKLFVDTLMELYFPFDTRIIKISPLKHVTYSEKKIQKIKPITLQSYHPPLYYFFISFSHHLSNLFNLDLISRFYMARLFSALFYFGIVFVAYKILRILFTSEYLISSLLLFFSLNPLVVKSGVSINPDIGMTFFSLLFLYVILRWQKKEVITLKQTIIFAFIAAASALSKFSGIFTVMVFPLYVCIKNRITKKTIMLSFLFFAVCSILLTPWFLLNINRYGSLNPSAFYIAENKPLEPHSIINAMVLSIFEFRHTIMHYAGFLGPRNNINPSKVFFVAYPIVISILAFIGFTVLLKNIKKKKNYLWIIIHFLSLGAFLFVLGTYFKKQGLSWDLQGRYFIAGFFSMTIFMYFGILKLLKNKGKLATQILFFSALMHFYYVLFFVLIPFYYRWNTILQDLNALYQYYDFFFITAFIFHVVLSFSITRKLFNPSSK